VALVLCCLSLGSFVFKTFFETMPHEAKNQEKEEISRSTLSTSTSALDSLIVEVSESCLFYNTFVRLALVVFCPLASLAGLVYSSSFNHSSWLQCDPRLLRAKDLVRRWTCGFHQIFASSASSKTKMGKNFLSWHKENLTRTKANLPWNNQIRNSSRAQMKYQTAFFVKIHLPWYLKFRPQTCKAQHQIHLLRSKTQTKVYSLFIV